MAVRDKVHLRAVGWAITLLVGAMFILVGALEFPLLSGKPISSAQGLDGTQLVEIFLNRQCINTKCDRVRLPIQLQASLPIPGLRWPSS
jgi:hypothetical protein